MSSDSGMDYESVDELAAVFSKKIDLIRTSLETRKIDEESVRRLHSAEKSVLECRVVYDEIRTSIKTFEDQLVELQDLLKKLEVLNQKLDYMQQNLPPAILQEKANKSLAVNGVKEPASGKKEHATMKNSKNKDPVKMQCVTVDEFKGVPAYMKGRMKYEQVNKFVNDFNTAVACKYKLLSLPRKEMKPADLKVIQKLKSQENVDTKGLYFCTSDDLKEYGKMKLDKISNNLLTILRHCRKMKEIRGPGPIVRYAII